jgi:hypothetical protein
MVLSLGFACGACGVKYSTLAQHFRWHPECDPKPLAVPVRPAAPLVQCNDGLFGKHLLTDGLREGVLWDLFGMRIERDFTDDDIRHVKAVSTRWMLAQAPLASQRLQEANLLAPGASPESVLEQLKPELFQGVETSRLEVAARKKEYRSLEPRVTDLSGRGCRDADHLVVSFSAVELLTQRLQQDSEFRRK